LVEASLLLADNGEAGEARFALLETIREYGAEQLAAQGETDSTRERHAVWALALAEVAEPQLFQAEQQTWWRRLEAERPNMRAALAWFEEVGDAERGQRLAGALWPFCWFRGHLREGQDWLDRALAIPGPAAGPARAWAMVGQAGLAWNRGDFDAAWILAERARTAAIDAGFPRGAAVAQLLLAATAWMHDDLDRALDLGAEAVARLRAAGDAGWLAVFLVDMGTMTQLHGDEERGRAWSAEGLALNRALGNRWIVANHLSDLGLVAHSRGDLVEAVRRYAESVRLFRDVGDTWFIAGPLAGFAGIAAAQDRAETAARLLGAAAALHEASGAAAWTTEHSRDEQTAAAAQAALSAEGFARALEAGRALTLHAAVEEALAIAAAAAGPTESRS
jgi:non-specific serine/threonine protein kinase